MLLLQGVIGQPVSERAAGAWAQTASRAAAVIAQDGGMAGERRQDIRIEDPRLVNRRLAYGAEGCAAYAAELDGAFLAILDDGTLNDFLPDEEPMGGRRVYAFPTAAERDGFLAEQCRGMRRLDWPC